MAIANRDEFVWYGEVRDLRRDVDVIVIGGGPGGLALGAALNQLGLSAVILEAASQVAIASRGEFLQPNGIRVLEHLGVLSALRAQDVWVNRKIHTYAPGGTLLADLDYSVLEPPHNYVLIHKPHLLRQALLSALGSTEIRWGTRCERLERVGDTWRVKVRDSNGEEALQARVVVGADGARSWVRETLANIRAEGLCLGSFRFPHRNSTCIGTFPRIN